MKWFLLLFSLGTMPFTAHSSHVAWNLLTTAQQEKITKTGIFFGSLSLQFSFNIFLMLKYGSGSTFLQHLQSLYGPASATTLQTGTGAARRPLPGGGYAPTPAFTKAQTMYDRLTYVSNLPWLLSSAYGSGYFAHAYMMRNNSKQWGYLSGMGTGHTIQSMLLASGGATQLPRPLKYSLYGLSATATLLEAKKQLFAGLSTWHRNRMGAYIHWGCAGVLALSSLLPFALDHYKNKAIGKL